MFKAARAAEAGEGHQALNARAEGAWLERIAALDPPGAALLARAAEAGALSARGWSRTLRLARTIADLEGQERVRRVHIAEALIYRRIGPAAEGVGESEDQRLRLSAPDGQTSGFSSEGSMRISRRRAHTSGEHRDQDDAGAAPGG